MRFFVAAHGLLAPPSLALQAGRAAIPIDEEAAIRVERELVVVAGGGQEWRLDFHIHFFIIVPGDFAQHLAECARAPPAVRQIAGVHDDVRRDGRRSILSRA